MGFRNNHSRKGGVRVRPLLLLRQSLAALLSTVLVVQPVLVRAQVAPDLGAPIGNQPGVGAAPNGVPLVDIVTPNATGLSHNKYSDFNVGTPGLILNNSTSEAGTSLLGGVTPGNVNLKNSGPATIILNEVTSGRRSALEGAIEVFGGRADVIVANPNGITCSGCGFINTPRATLTTGTPDIDGLGKLSGFTVQGGDVTFGSKGGNFAQGAGAVDLFDIVSRRIQIDGPVAGKQLRLSAGRQKTDYASGDTTAIAGPDDAPEFAIDGTAFGAMQADRIKIIVTDKGAGVRMRSEMAANAGELTLSADGKISLGNVSGRDGVHIQSKSQQADAKKITSKKQVVVKADKGLTLESVAADEDVVLDAGRGLLSVAGDVAGLGNVTLTAMGAIAVNKVTAAQNADLNAGQGIRGEALIADGGARLKTDAGNVVFADTVNAGGGDLTLMATSGDIQAGSLISFNNMSLTAGQDILIGEAILAGGALIADAASIKAASAASGVDFAATQAADGAVKLQAAGPHGDMQLRAEAGAIEIATLLSGGRLDAKAQTFAAQSVISQDAVTINADTAISGQLLSGSDITVTGPAIAIDVSAAGISLAALYDHNTIIPAESGSLTLSATVGNVLGRQFLSTGNMAVTSNADVTASLISHGDIDVRAATLNADTVTSYGATRIAGTAHITGQLLAGSDITIRGAAITLATAVAGVDLDALARNEIVPGLNGALTLVATAGDIAAEQLISARDMAVNAAGSVTANIISHGGLAADAGDQITLLGQSLVALGAKLHAGSLDLGTLVSGIDFAATKAGGEGLVVRRGNPAIGAMQLNASDGSIRADALLSGGDLHALAQKDLSYNSLQSFAGVGLQSVEGTISLDHDTIANNDITLRLQSLDLSNDRSKIATAGTLIVDADRASLANSTLTFGGVDLNLNGVADMSGTRLQAVTADGGSGDIAIAAQTVTTTSATTLLAAHDLSLSLASLENAGQLASGNNLTLTVSGDVINAATGLIYAGRDGQLKMDGTLRNDQGAILAGHDLAFANLSGTGKSTALINHAGLIRASNNLSIQTQSLLNEADSTPEIGERVEEGSRYTFGTPEHYEELWDNDTPMRGRLFYDPLEAIRWGRGGCSEKHGDPCDVTWLDKGLWQTKEETYGYVTLPDGSIYRAFTWNKVDSNDGKGKIWYAWNDQAAMSEQIRTQYFVSKLAKQGLIEASGNITIDATTIDNLYSAIEGGGDVAIKSDVLNNKGMTLYKDVFMTCLASNETCYGYDADGSRNAARDISAGSSQFIKREVADTLSSTIRAGGRLGLDVAQLNNEAAEGSVAGNAHFEASPVTGDTLSALNGLSAGGALFTPRVDLNALTRDGQDIDPALIAAINAGTALSAPKPQSGGFGGTLPNQNFIYETRAEFLDVSRFYGSGYFLSRIGYQPDHQLLFLGDAYFENELIDKQMREATGYGLAGTKTDTSSQMKSLLDNGADYAQAQGLAFGEPLSAEQVANLESSVVVYVKQDINGVSVYAPVLYVAAKDRENLVASGAMLEGKDVVIAGGDVSNSGLIAAKTNLRVDATTISTTGGGFAAAGDVTLAASGNINLKAATTSFNGESVVAATDTVSAGGNAVIQSGKEITLEGAAVKAGKDLAIEGESVNIAGAKGTALNESEQLTGSNIQAGGDVKLNARTDLSVSGSAVQAGGDLALNAQAGNLTIQSAEASRKDGFGETTTQHKSTLSSGGATSLEASKNVVIAGSDVKAGSNLTVEAGEGVAIIATEDKASGTFGSNSFETTTQQGSNLTSGGDTAIKAGTDVLIGASGVAAGGNLDLQAKGDINVVAMAESNEEKTRGKIYRRDETTTTAVGSSLKAGGDVNATAGSTGEAHDLNIIGSKVEAGGKVGLSATNDVNILAAESSYDLQADFHETSSGPFGKTRSWSRNESDTTQLSSAISGKDGVDITSGNNTTIAASKIAAGDADHKADLNIDAGGDLIISSGKDTVDVNASKSKSGFLSSKSDKGQDYNETTVASELSASGDVNLNAERNVAIAGSKVAAGDNIAIEGASVAIIGAQERHDHEAKSKKTGLGVGSGDGFYTVYGSQKNTEDEHIVANVGSELKAGSNVEITARKNDVNIVGSHVEAGNDIALTAARDVNILPGHESYESEETETRYGLGVRVKATDGSASIGIGYGSTKDSVSEGAETNAVSTLKAGHDVVITAGRDANLQAAKVEAEHDVAITAERDVNLLAAQDKTNYEQMHEELFVGVTETVSSRLAGAAGRAVDSAKKLGGENAEYAIAPTILAGIKTEQELAKALSGNAPLFSVGVGIGFSSEKTEQEASTSTPVVTEIRSGGSTAIRANGGSITGHGAQIVAGVDSQGRANEEAGNIALTARDNINLSSAQASYDSDSSTKTAGASVGIGVDVGLNGIGFGPTADVSFGSGKTVETATKQVNSHVSGTGIVVLNSGNDTNLKGAVVSGNSVIAYVGGDLNIESIPDTASYREKDTSGSAGISTSGVTGGFNKTTVKGDYSNVAEQSGIVAGEGGYHIAVGNGVDLKGGVIASTADKDKNSLSADHLTYSDIENYSEASSSSVGVALTPSGFPVPVVGQPAKEEDHGVAKATLTPGNVTLTNQKQDLKDLNTDLSTANEQVDHYDIDRVKAKQESAAALSEILNTGVGDLAGQLGFAEGSPEKAALHAAVGAIVASMAGGDAGIGALAGGASEIVNGVLQAILKEYPDLTVEQKSVVTQWVAAAVGAATGGAQGAATALDNVNHNFLYHEEILALKAATEQCNDGNWDACRQAYEINELDIARNARLREACGVAGNSFECQRESEQLRAALASLTGNNAGLDLVTMRWIGGYQRSMGDDLDDPSGAKHEMLATLSGAMLGLGGTIGKTVEGAAEGAATFSQISTPWSVAVQATTPEALAARSLVEEGATLYRVGTMGKSAGAEAQFWSLENPSNPGYAARYGIPPENVANIDFIETATLNPGTQFITRPAPGFGTNPGGGIEVVLPPNGVTMKYFGVQ
jgi:filamentous hemagglutinin